MSYLVDTNVLSEARRTQGHPAVRAWLAGAPADQLFLSVLTLGEVRRGIERLRARDVTQARALDRWLTALSEDYADRLLPVTIEVAEEWGRMNAARPLPVVDGLLGATARVHGLTLVTRNTADLSGAGVALLDPSA